MNPIRFRIGISAAPLCVLLLWLSLWMARADAWEYFIEIQTNATATGASGPKSQEQIIKVLEKRAQGLGGGEVVPEGPDRVRVRLFNVRPQDRLLVSRALGRAGLLEFRLVHSESDDLVARGETVAGYEALQMKEHLADGRERLTSLLVKRQSERGLNGSYITRASVGRGHLGRPEILFELNPEGAALFAQVTADNIGRRLAIVLDGELCSAPRIMSEIPGGRGMIEGNFEIMEAIELANALENPIGASLNIIEEKAVDPAVEQAYRGRVKQKQLLMVGGAVVFTGLVIGGLVFVLLRVLRRKSDARPPATASVPPRLS
jgi:preprotein translocase subunit SecD